MTNNFLRSSLLVCFFAVLGSSCNPADRKATNSSTSDGSVAESQPSVPLPVDPKLEQLRAEFAGNYLKPEAHYALAKYYLDNGNKVQAFYIIETARETRFSREDFDSSYKAFFGDNSAEPSAEAKDAFETGSRLGKEGKTDEAEQYLLKAAELGPKSPEINAWLGRFYYKVKTDKARAMPYYFNAYFLYPHAYETEYVESRMRDIAVSNAGARFAEMKKTEKSFIEISRDADPVVVGLAVEQMSREWKPVYLDIMLECMSNDDDEVRYGAFMAISKNAGASLDQTLSALLADKDLRKRGLAAYGVAEHWPNKRLNILTKMLEDSAELIRFDAMSALMISCGAEGAKIVKQHRGVEKSQRLKDLIDKAGQPPTAQQPGMQPIPPIPSR